MTMVEASTLEYTRKKLAQQRKAASLNANRASLAEKAERAIARNRDVWKARALKAEAKLQSLGIDAALQEET